jgi:hypothetical protein
VCYTRFDRASGAYWVVFEAFGEFAGVWITETELEDDLIMRSYLHGVPAH